MYEPTYDGEVAGYVVNFLKKNYWRVESSVPYDDSLQEAYCVFLKCKRRYAPNGEDDGRQFMGLFKKAWFNHFTDLCNEDTALREAVVFAEEAGYDIAGTVDNDGYLATMVRQAPREIGMVLSLFLNAPAELLDLALAGWRAQGDKRMRSGGSRQINRLLGLPDDRDTLKEVADYFNPHS